VADELDTPNIRCENCNISSPPGSRSSVLLYLQKNNENSEIKGEKNYLMPF